MTDTLSTKDLTLSHRDALPFGTQLSEFEIQGLLGVGGFGMVYKAWDHSLRRGVAIKEFMPTAMAGREEGLSVSVRSSADESSFYSGLRSFVAEAQLLAQFDHPSLVKVFRIWEANNTAYMVMPLYAGQTLKEARDLMSRPPSEPWLRKVLWSVTEALKVLHAGNTMHRDISPDNIFLQDKGPPVLLDLGAARRAMQERTQKHTAILKVNYAPIEQYGDNKDFRQGPWTDLYALAAVVHGCVCNEPPPPATFRLLDDRMTPFADVAQSVHTQFGLSYTAPFVAAIDAALAVRPDDRVQSVEDFAELMLLRPASGMADFDWRAEFGGKHARSSTKPTGLTINLDQPAPEAAPAPAFPIVPQAPERRRTPSDASAEKRERRLVPRQPMAGAPPAANKKAVTVVARPAPAPAADADDDAEAWAPTQLESDSSFAAANEAGADAAQKSGRHGRHGGQNRRAGLLALGAGLALTVGVAIWAFSGSRAKPNAMPPAAAASASAGAAPEISASAPLQPAAPTAAVTTPAVVAPGANAAAAAPRPTVAAASRPASAPVRKNNTPSAPTPQVIEVRPAVPVLPATTAPVAEPPKPAPSAVARPQPARPAELCADANVFSRPMCVHNECQKPGMSNHPACVEQRQQLQRNQREF